MLGAVRAARPAGLGRRSIHATACAKRTNPPMISFKYGHNKGKAKAPKAKKAAAVAAPKAAKAAGAPAYTDVPISAELLAFGGAAVAYKQAVVHTYMDIKVDVTEVTPFIETLKTASAGLCLTDVVMRCASLALEAVPAANAVHVGGGVCAEMATTDIALVTRGDGGVVGYSVVPTTNLLELSAARQAGGAPGAAALGVEFSGDGSGVPAKAYRTVLQPGLSSVLTVGSVQVEVGVNEAGDIGLVQSMTLGLTVDPTVMDAFVAGEFLQTLGSTITEMPGRALAANTL
jgi:pyruvate/2-oxoglutarate dehydrogenase complex dihydrolipoamide acyltransferase (E2) component